MKDTLVLPIEAKLTYPTITAQDFLSIFPRNIVSSSCLLEGVKRWKKLQMAL